MEGLVLSGGEGIPAVMTRSMGELFPEMGSFTSATDGDCKGDW